MSYTWAQLCISFVCPSIISCTVNTPIFGSDSFVISILSIARHSSAIRSRDKNDVIYGRPVFGHDKSLFANEIVFVSFSPIRSWDNQHTVLSRLLVDEKSFFQRFVDFLLVKSDRVSFFSCLCLLS